MIGWESSGSGPAACALTLRDAQLLAIEAGFAFKGADDSAPLARRADLQAMFEHFGVNSLSAFRQKFWSCELRPHTPGSARLGSASSGAAAPALPPPATPRSRWQVQQQGDETYVGELLDGRRHGSGILLTRGQRSWVLHVGHFLDGKPNGPGVVATSRGERFEGHFLDGIMWGPGEYRYALPEPPSQPPPPPAAAAAAAGVTAAAAGGDTEGGAEGGAAAVGAHLGSEAALVQGDEDVPAAGAAGQAQQQAQAQGAALHQEQAQQRGQAQAQGAALHQEQAQQRGQAQAQGAALHQEQAQQRGQAQAQGQAQGQLQPHRVLFQGMMNGRPQGRGRLTWSDASQQAGLFDGNNCFRRLPDGDGGDDAGVAGAVMVAADNARAARAAAEGVRQQAQRQEGSIAEQARQLVAAVSPPGQAATSALSS